MDDLDGYRMVLCKMGWWPDYTSILVFFGVVVVALVVYDLTGLFLRLLFGGRDESR